jgi:hypothetical protein
MHFAPVFSAVITVDVPNLITFMDPVEDAAAQKIVIASPQSGDVRKHCEVHVHQDVHGAVQAVDFGECTPDDAWQKAILQAIQRSAALMKPSALGAFPPVRTFRFETEAISTTALARELSGISNSERRSSVNAAD